MRIQLVTVLNTVNAQGEGSGQYFPALVAVLSFFTSFFFITPIKHVIKQIHKLSHTNK